MQVLKSWFSRMTGWRVWRTLGMGSTEPALKMPAYPDAFAFPVGRTILRDVSPNGVRVYSLCGSCGAQLAASATLCDACARGRSPSANP